MGTEIHCKSYFTGLYSMRDLNDGSGGSSWPLFYGEKMVANAQCYNGITPRTLENGCSAPEKNTLKQKMLEHETVFKNQVSELHRLYRIQRDMMVEFKMNEPHKNRASMEASSSSLQGTQVPSEEARKWKIDDFPLSNYSHGRTSAFRVEKFSSPTSCNNGNSMQPVWLPFQNGCITKNSEALDSRPLKVRKKLFDLQLPADEYVDPEEEENLYGYQRSDVSSYSRTGHPNNSVASIMELIPGEKADHLVETSPSVGCLRGSVGLADLNEPIEIEEATAPSSIDFLGHTSKNGATKTIEQHAESTGHYFNVAGEAVHVRDGISLNSSVESQVNDRGWLSHVNRAGPSNLSSVIQSCPPEKLPLSSHCGKGTINGIHPHVMYLGDYSSEDKWREGFGHGIEYADRFYSHSNNGHLEPTNYHPPGSHPFFSSPSFASSWRQTVSSWAHPSSTSTPKRMTLETQGIPVEAPSALCQKSFGESWHVDSSSKSNRGLVSELKSNGFYQGPHSLHGFESSQKVSHRSATKPPIDINLNEELPGIIANEDVIMQDLNMVGGKRKPEKDIPGLPWLKPKPVCVDEVTDTTRSELSRELKYCHDSSNELCSKNKMTMSASCDSTVLREKETAAPTRAVKKILGFPIFERDVRENELSSHAPTPVGVGDVRKNLMIDINIACEAEEQLIAEEPTMEKEKQKKVTPRKGHFDLNSCVSDSDGSSSSFKITMEIDLEVPILLESEDDSTESTEKMLNELSSHNLDKEMQDEVLRDAAEALVGISSCPQLDEEDLICLPCEDPMGEEALLLLANAISPDSNNEVANVSPQLDSFQEMDDFEAIALQLVETKTDDDCVMPKLPFPQLEKVEDIETRPLHTRTRRGRARRGRQWRDFQRDVLPGLASLSRHEVTEDIQIFGGMMRATGHTWSSGLARRNGTRNRGGRGRRRAVVETAAPAVTIPVCVPLVQQQLSMEAGFEERSLTTGWGKTTRRPRRQRCPAGIAPPVVLT